MRSLEQVNALLAEGNEACRTQDYDKAIELFERGISIASAAWGDRGYQLVYPLLGLARATGRGRGIEGHPEIARVMELEERAVAIAEEYPEVYQQHLPSMVGRLGSTLRIAGRRDEARKCLEKVVAMSETMFGDAWSTAHAHGGLANLLLEMKLPGDALPHFRRAVSIEASLTPKKSHFVSLALLGRCLLDLGRGREALPYLERALAMRMDATGDVDSERWTTTELGEWIAEARESSDGQP